MPLFVVAHFSHHVVGALLTPLLPSIRDHFSLSETQVGLLGSAYNLPYGLSQLPFGWLADRLGARTLITVGITGVATAGLLVGLSPTYVVMVVFLILLGLSGGGYHPAAAPLVSASVDERNRGSALGLHQIGGTLSFFLAPLIAAGLAGALGWRGSFISVSVPTIILGIALYLILGRRGYTRGLDTGAADGAEQPQAAPTRMSRLIAFIALGVVLQVLLFSALWFVPNYAVSRLGASEAAAAALLSLYHFAGFFAGPLGGLLSDRLGKVPVLLGASLIGGPAIYLLTLTSMGWSIWVVLLLMGTCQYTGMPVSEAYVISHTSERNRSTVLGIYYLASRGGPGLIMPALGYLIDRFGFDTSFGIAAAALAGVTVICGLFLWSSRD